MKKIIMMLVILGLVNIAAVSEAAMDVRIDFQNGGATPSGNWNTIELSGYTTVTSGLKDYNTGLATTVSTVGVNWGSFTHSEIWTPPVDWVETNAAIDGFCGHGTSTQTFSGLNSLKQYKVEVVSAESGLPTVTFTINGLYADTNYDNTMTGNVSQDWNMQTARTNQDWMIWSSITPNAAGDLVVTSVSSPGAWAAFNAVRISEIPEPATMAILGLGALLSRKFKTA